ncbi:fasciclin domain-containing protein [Candidatus Amarolinea dominans]|uniref:fasciclin domain-containing protein n=1 Tax=Candidatus Amarolinea dominans TaxID=3140696 RepID=UPI003137583F|nr:fasciclin domain-containing protein [Anaerolineae bacterium]
MPAPAAKDIVDTAVADGRFKTLVAAVQAAGLVETLKGEGPFTVFAPTDEAFAKLPAGTVEGLLKEPESSARGARSKGVPGLTGATGGRPFPRGSCPGRSKSRPS